MAEERSSCRSTTCEREQALLSDGLVFVKLDFNGTDEDALFIGGVQSFEDSYSCDMTSQILLLRTIFISQLNGICTKRLMD